MRTSTKPIADAAKLDGFVATVQRGAEGAEADPFDEAMVAAVAVTAEAMRAQAAEIEAVRGWMARVARRLARG